MEMNEESLKAWDIIEKTSANLFLTGKAGTGKTTFLKELKRRSPKRMVVLAPTGIAAINAGGVTILMAWLNMFPARKYTKFISWDILVTIASAFAIAAILMVLALLINLAASLVSRYFRRKNAL